MLDALAISRKKFDLDLATRRDCTSVVSWSGTGGSPAPWTEFSGSVIAGGGGFVVAMMGKHVSTMLLTCGN